MVDYGGSPVAPVLQLSPPMPALGRMLDRQSLSYDRLLCGLELSASHPSTRTPLAGPYSLLLEGEGSARAGEDIPTVCLSLSIAFHPSSATKCEAQNLQLTPQCRSTTVTGRPDKYINLASMLSAIGSHVVVIAHS